MNQMTFYIILAFIVLVILGFISFHSYSYLHAKDTLKFGAGFGVTMPAKPLFKRENK